MSLGTQATLAHRPGGLSVEQEPVAWVSDSPTKGNGKQLHFTKANAWKWSSNITPLYTAPPSKPWVSLTDEDKSELYNLKYEDYLSDYIGIVDFILIAGVVEAALRSKNT